MFILNIKYKYLFSFFVFQAAVYTSTTNKKPSSYSSKSLVRRTTSGNKIYTTFVPSNAKNFYFSVKGLHANMNKFDFVVRVRQI